MAASQALRTLSVLFSPRITGAVSPLRKKGIRFYHGLHGCLGQFHPIPSAKSVKSVVNELGDQDWVDAVRAEG
jgi:hypothetical protein